MAELHARNGILGFSDRMNSYNAATEMVLAVAPATLDASALEPMAELAGILAFAAKDIA